LGDDEDGQCAEEPEGDEIGAAFHGGQVVRSGKGQGSGGMIFTIGFLCFQRSTRKSAFSWMG